LNAPPKTEGETNTPSPTSAVVRRTSREWPEAKGYLPPRFLPGAIVSVMTHDGEEKMATVIYAPTNPLVEPYLLLFADGLRPACEPSMRQA